MLSANSASPLRSAVNNSRRILTVQCLVVLLLILSGTVRPSRAADLYQDVVQPFATKYCVECHNPKKARGELDLTKYSTEKSVTSHFRRWQNITAFIRDGEMPPEDSKLQPTIAERNSVMDWELRHVMPVKWNIVPFEATSNKVATETLEIAHMGFLVDEA